MSTGGFRVTALRVKLPCEDEKDFYARFADAIAEKGLRVPTANLRPIGSKVRFVLEFRDGRTVSGEAVVDAHVEGARPAMNVRLLKFEKPSVTPPPAPRAPAEASPPPPPAPVVASPAALAAPTPETSFESLFAQQDEPEEPAAAEPPRPAPPGTEELEPLFGPLPGSAAAAAREDAAPEPTPEATPSKATAKAPPTVQRRHPIPPASRRTAIGAVAAVVVLGLGLLLWSASRPRPPGREAAPSAAPGPDAVLATRIAGADRRLAEGRLTGPDGALDQLLAARALAPDDARVTKRLAMLADTLERLGGRAADRGDVAEAEVHLGAALQAAPERRAIAARLEALAKLPHTPERRDRAAADAEPAR